MSNLWCHQNDCLDPIADRDAPYVQIDFSEGYEKAKCLKCMTELEKEAEIKKLTDIQDAFLKLQSHTRH